MSVHSGFHNRNHQMIYDSLIYNILSVLAIRIMKFYKKQEVQQNKFKQVLEIQTKYLKKLENKKFSEPKYSVILDQLYSQIFCIHPIADQGSSPELTSRNTNNKLNKTFAVLANQLGNPIQSSGKKNQIRQKSSQKNVEIDDFNKIYWRQKLRIFKNKTLHMNDKFDNQKQIKNEKNEKMPELPNYRINQNQYSVPKIKWKDLKGNDYPFYQNNTTDNKIKMKSKQQHLRRATHSEKTRNSLK